MSKVSKPTVVTPLFAPLFVVALAVLCLAPGLRSAHARDAPDVVAAKLRPFVDLQLPHGDPPYPLAVLAPGCLGWLPHHAKWRTSLLDKGFAVLYVDSFGARGLTDRTQLAAEVCTGARVPGAQRAGDLMAVLAQVWRRDDIRPAETIFMGWSHGGWAVMDFLVMAARKIPPPNVSLPPNLDVNNVLAAFLFYPYCGFGSLSGARGFPASVVVRVYQGTADRITSPGACRARVKALAASGADIQYFSESGAGHGFDNFAEPRMYQRRAAVRVKSQVEQELDRLVH